MYDTYYVYINMYHIYNIYIHIDTEYDLFANLIESYQAISIRFESNLDTSIQSMYSSLLHYSKFSNPGTGLSRGFFHFGNGETHESCAVSITSNCRISSLKHAVWEITSSTPTVLPGCRICSCMVLNPSSHVVLTEVLLSSKETVRKLGPK